ncbi:hypothetical protein SDC9_07743 [bioreactor metagenome]|uniref:SET domain-containing protein n=1 Tax=bioreactor metagenome TaxID=1076179 RepID=A0A644T5M6_9ZZZZ|nr:SET domain-containing protein-lysine N-methyltransferase [Candidatus Elulimicrobiales bacterium]
MKKRNKNIQNFSKILNSFFNLEKKLPAHHYKKVKVKKGLAELGLFADEDIKKSQLIIEYIGKTLSDKEIKKDPDNKYIFSVEKDFNIDGSSKKNIARYANHSCDPNAESEIKNKRVFLRAIKNISKGEEITFDYGEEYVKEFLLNKCKCGSEKHLYHDK